MIPSSLNKLKLKTYIQLLDVVADKSLEKLDSKIKQLSIITGKPESYFEALEFDVLEYCYKPVAALLQTTPKQKVPKWVCVRGRFYKPQTDATKLSFNQYTAIKQLSSQSGYKNIHKIASIVFYSAWSGKFNDSEREKIEKLFYEHATLGQVYSTVFFYSKVSKKVKPYFQLYLIEAHQTITDEIRKITQEYGTGLRKNTTGIT